MSSISQLGQINLSALNVPGAYIQIVAPQYLFAGVSSNIGGFVGTAPWGPVNVAQPFANYTQYSTIFGPTINRNMDMGAHVLLAAAQGGAGSFYGVRVSDGTDTAAQAPINATGASAAVGSITFTTNPVAATTVTLNGSVWTFVASLTTGLQMLIGASLAATLANALAAFQASADSNTQKFTYSQNGTVLTLLAAATGVGGNALTIATTVSGATASGATLSGGTAATVGMTITGKYTGSLGNSLKATLTQGSQSGLATYASGAFNFTTNPTSATTITLNGTVWTFVNAITTGPQILLGSTLTATLANVLIYLAATTDANTLKMNYAVSGNTLTATSRQAGTAGNAYTISTNVTGATTSGATLSGGLAATTTVKLTLSLPGVYPEQFDNIGAGLTGNALWLAIVNAVNTGVSSVRGPSQLAIATVGAGVAYPTFGTVTLSGGTDGAAGVTALTLLGTNGIPRTGMYALTGTQVSQAMLCDCYDTTTFSTQMAWGLANGCYMIATTAPGDTVLNAVTELGNAGIDSFTIKVMFGDWVYWPDTVNNIPYRLTSPQGVVMGMLCNLSPQESTLNLPVLGIIGTQRSISNLPYSPSDLQMLGQAQMDVIANPSPGGNYFSCNFGKNTSSNQVIFGDEYTRVTYFLAKSLEIIAGYFVGQTQTPTERQQAKTAILAFLQLAQQNGIIGNASGTLPYQVVLDTTNNSQNTTALGYQFAYVAVTYFGIVRYFVVDLQGGASVVISQAPPSGFPTQIP